MEVWDGFFLCEAGARMYFDTVNAHRRDTPSLVPLFIFKKDFYMRNLLHLIVYENFVKTVLLTYLDVICALSYQCMRNDHHAHACAGVNCATEVATQHPHGKIYH